MKKVEYVDCEKAESLQRTLKHTTATMRTHMTSITRYLKLNRDDHPTLNSKEFAVLKYKYGVMAFNAMEHILKFLNDNPELDQMCNMDLSPDVVMEQNDGPKWGCPCDINGNPISTKKKAPKKEYVEVNSFLEAATHMAMYQNGERQQGILGVLSTLENWPRADVK